MKPKDWSHMKLDNSKKLLLRFCDTPLDTPLGVSRDVLNFVQFTFPFTVSTLYCLRSGNFVPIGDLRKALIITQNKKMVWCRKP